MKAKLSFSLLLALTAGLYAAVEPGFKSLFNGKDLTGWEGNLDLWSVQDGFITGKTPPSPEDPQKSTLKHNTFLVSKAEFSNFELRFSYRIVPNNNQGFGNSGVQYRSKVIQQGEMGPIVSGYQADFEAGKTYSGILYEERARGILAQRGQKTVIKADGDKHKVEVTGSLGKSEDIQAKIKAEQWNDYVVIANGNHLQHFINGVPTVDVTDEDEAHAAKTGILGLQIHVGGPMTVQFKNIRIKELGAHADRSDLEMMQGEWAPVELQANGENVNKDDLASVHITVKDQNYEVKTADGGDNGTFELNPTQKPGWLDATNKDGQHVRAIYEINGNRWRICYALDDSPRPDSFTTSPDSKRIYAVYEKK